MLPASFEWDPLKAAVNLQRHGVSFADARTGFRDPLAKVFSDPDHSDDEERAIIIGRSQDGRLLLVSFVDRGRNIQLISARDASRRERHKHEEEV